MPGSRWGMFSLDHCAAWVVGEGPETDRDVMGEDRGGGGEKTGRNLRESPGRIPETQEP